MEIRALIRKIGHSLLEIRVRALKSIICKLDHSLLSISDVVQERMLFVLLLEWFNFPEVPLQEEVLQLLSTLSKHETGAQMLRDVGAVEFFTQLSPNLEPCLRTVVNDIVEQLFHLPDLFTACPTVCSQEQAGITSALPLEQSAPTVGYFQSSKPNQADIPPQRQAVSNVVRCLKFSTFPWLTLNTTDRHILSSNESSLRSNNHNLVRSTCELLRDVIMQDFPAEIFLQRPSIVQNLLSLLRLGPGEGEAGYLRLQAAACLQQLSVALRTRLRFHRDPSFYSAKQDPVSQNSSMSYSQDVRGTQVQRSLASSPGAECSPRPSVVGRTAQRASGDGQDGDATSSSGSSHGAGGGSQAARQTPQSPADAAQLELPDLGAEDVLELQLQQLSLPQFAVTTLEHATPLLRTDGPRVFQRVLELLRETSELLGDSICELVWDDHSLLGMELREKLQSSLAEMGEILRYHQSCPEDSPPGLLLHHRMAYVGTAVFTIRLLQTILPLEKASENLPECTAAILLPLSLDRPFSLLFPSMHEAAVAYLEQVNSDGHALYRRVARAALCMESTCAFLKEKQAEGERNWPELLELADQAVEGLPFHQHLPIIRDCLNICSDLWKIDQASPFLKTASQKVFLKLLSHPLLPVKTETYSCTLSVVKHCLGVHNKSKPGSSVCCGIHFLLHARVLYEISAFGLQDPAEKVSAAAKDILLFLLKGRLMMSAATWDRLNQAVYPVIPILQSYADTEGVLGSCVLLVSEVSEPGKDDTAPHTLRAALRLLFTKQHTVRVKAVEHLLPYLADEKDLTLSSLPSLFCLSASLDISLDSSERSFLKAESVEKLFAILTSDTVDSSLRRSAAEQLAVVLQDTAMHPVLKRLGVTDTVAAFITDGVSGDVKGPGSLLEPCMCILRKLVFADPSLRHRLARQQGLLLALLRAALLIKENGGDVREVAALMCLLLFDEIATVDSWCDTAGTSSLSPFSLPVSVLRRYNLPFQSASHHAVSPHCSVLPPSADLLALPPARHALQLAWNAAWHSGIGNLLEERSLAADFHSDLLLSEVQLLLLRATHLPSGLQDCIQAIVMAAGHRSVTSAVSRLRLYRLTDRLALTHAHTPGFRNTLPSLNWRPAIARFLQVRPACTEDERLLVDIVAFLNGHFEQRCPDSEGDDQDLCWILELLLNQETSSLLDPLLGVQPHMPARTQGELEEVRNLLQQRLQRELTSFFNTLLRCLQHTTDRRCLTMAGPFESQLAVRLLQSLRVSDAPRFYGLPSLERTLLGMVNLTAQPGWSRHSLEPHALRLKYLSGLLEVISSFYVEWGGNSMSFMGKGVTKNAVICLLHLSHEMIAEGKDKDFISQWSLGHEAGSEEPSGSQLGLAWLIPLWVDRDPEVRFASLGVGSSLSSLPSGCHALCASCHNISGGLWGTLLNILLDPQESSMVRREAAFILQNLLVMPMPANADEAKDSPWQNPCVHDEASGVSLVGLPALQALLYHCQFFQHVSLMASTCYRGRYTFPLQPSSPAPAPSAQDGQEAEDSLNLWRSCAPAAHNQSRACGSLSTSSTLLLPGGSRPHSPAATSPSGTAQDTPASRLMAQGQSDTDTSSVISQDSRPGDPSADTCAIVTPDLLSALCGLLHNLLAVLPDFTLGALLHSQLLQSLASLVDSSTIERCVSELRALHTLPGHRADVQSQVLTLLQYLSSCCRLLQTCVGISQELIGQADFLKPLLANVVAVLTLDSKDLAVRVQVAVHACWTDLLTLLATLVSRAGSVALPSVSAALGRRWQPFSDTLSVCVDGSDLPLHAAALHFLCVLLSAEANRRSLKVTATPPDPVTALSETLNGAPGGHMCELLLQSFEKRSLQDPLKMKTARALAALLACSPTAQEHAAKAGLIDSCVEQLKQRQAQLQLESVRPGRGGGAPRRKEESYMKEVKMAAEILRNCLYRNDECKAVATDARLAPVLQALWPWLLGDDAAMEAVLELLCVYTASCTAACSAVCSTGGVGVAPGPRGAGSLMHLVMRLASGLASDHSLVQRLAFSLLANLAVSRDCRGVLHKSHFLQGFLSVPVPKAGGGRAGGLLGLWLRLLVCVTQGEDGQLDVLRLNGALELLADVAQQHRHGNRPLAADAILILHNVCFCSANKPRLLANDKAMKVFLSCLDSKDTDIQSMGAAALWALLHNNQKAKTTLKCPSVRLLVDEAYAATKKDAEKRQDPMNTYLLKCLESLSQLLNS